MTADLSVYPFRPRDWVFDGYRVARVKRVWNDGTEQLFDLVMFSRTGDQTGRESPVMGGPRTYEPACSMQGWQRISEPEFPLALKWLDAGDGKVTSGYYAGKPLPPANWTPPKRKARPPRFPKPIGDAPTETDILIRTLERIRDGHNDPRALAAAILGTRR